MNSEITDAQQKANIQSSVEFAHANLKIAARKLASQEAKDNSRLSTIAKLRKELEEAKKEYETSKKIRDQFLGNKETDNGHW